MWNSKNCNNSWFGCIFATVSLRSLPCPNKHFQPLKGRQRLLKNIIFHEKNIMQVPENGPQVRVVGKQKEDIWFGKQKFKQTKWWPLLLFLHVTYFDRRSLSRSFALPRLFHLRRLCFEYLLSHNRVQICYPATQSNYLSALSISMKKFLTECYALASFIYDFATGPFWMSLYHIWEKNFLNFFISAHSNSYTVTHHPYKVPPTMHPSASFSSHRAINWCLFSWFLDFIKPCIYESSSIT